MASGWSAPGHDSTDQWADCGKLEFPICTTPELFDAAVKGRKRLAGVPDGAIRRIHAVQPFHAPANTVAIHPLWLLHELNNLDKHQSVHISIGATHRGQVVVFDERNEALHTVDLPPTTHLGPITVDLPSHLPDNITCERAGKVCALFSRL